MVWVWVNLLGRLYIDGWVVQAAVVPSGLTLWTDVGGGGGGNGKCRGGERRGGGGPRPREQPFAAGGAAGRPGGLWGGGGGGRGGGAPGGLTGGRVGGGGGGGNQKCQVGKSLEGEAPRAREQSFSAGGTAGAQGIILLSHPCVSPTPAAQDLGIRRESQAIAHSPPPESFIIRPNLSLPTLLATWAPG